jgi:DNA-binding transcriptional ArsR family regulator
MHIARDTASSLYTLDVHPNLYTANIFRADAQNGATAQDAACNELFVTLAVFAAIAAFIYSRAHRFFMKESFMLVSLKEDKAKKLAQVMSNPTCTTILEYLAGKDATESQIAKDLSLPLSTVHYNVQQLVQAKLVVADEYHYSEKGREVQHYKLANKYIIIAPSDDETFLEKLKGFLPVVGIVGAVSVALKAVQWFTPEPEPILEAAPMAMKAMGAEAAGTLAMDAADTGLAVVQAPWWQSPMIDWFIIGAAFTLVVMLVAVGISHVRQRRHS